MLAEEPHGEEEQVVEVDGRRLVEPALVLGVDAREAGLVRADGLGGELVGKDEIVLERRDARVQLARREPLRVEIEVAPHPVAQADGVGLVVDRELRPVAEQRGLAAQDAHAEWNVETHMRRATPPTSAATRSFISAAALLVNVIARIENGDASRSAIR